MGWFNFGNTLANPSKGIIKGVSHEQIHNLLFKKLPHLTHEEREMVFAEIVKQYDDDGRVTGYEWEEKLDPIFYKWYKEGRIGEVDYRTLKKLGHELEAAAG